MTDAQLATILTSIMDILTEMNTAYVDRPIARDHAQTDAIAKVRALVAGTTKPLPFGGSGSVSV